MNNSKIDSEAVKSSRSIDDVIAGFIELKQNGREFEACCPFHEEKTPSFRVVPDKDFYHCFGCGANGDSIDFVMEHTGAGFRDACEVIAGRLDIEPTEIKQRKVERVDPYADYQPVTLPADAVIPKPGDKITCINPKRDHKTSTFKPSHVWPYRDVAGNLIAMVIRFDIDGSKITPCLRWAHHAGGEGWVMYAMPDSKRPLYNLQSLALNTSQQVVIVEGEKAAEALQQLVGMRLMVVSWSGGTKAVSKTDWTPLAGRKVIIIPDADEPGFDAAGEVMQQAIAVGADTIKVVIPEDDRPKGWDVADEKWESAEQFISWAKTHIGSLSQPDPEPEECTLADQDAYFAQPDDEPEPEPVKPSFNTPFQLLGYNDEYFYFLPKGSQQVKALTAPGLSNKANMLTLAPMEHWRDYAGLAPDEDVKTKHWEMHINGIIQKSYDIGVFDVSRIRGRGAWLDNGRNLLHVGDVVYVDGVKTLPEDIESKYIYPRNLGMHVDFVTPATNKEAHSLLRICERLSWDRSLSGALLAGWCVIAPLCGALKWRPHVWVTGPSASGKSTVLDDIISVMIGGIGIKVEGKTTEAGIRQQIGNDARPILFDEAEAEDEASARRMQGILDFARVSSSGGKIIKGSTGGKAMEFSARSAFCFSSINTTVKHFADETRITKLILKKDTTKTDEQYKEIITSIRQLITPEYANKMVSRSITYMDTIKENAEVFKDAASIVFNSRRIADQIGTMLAGTFLCHSTKVVTVDQAREWIERFDWTEHTAIGAKADYDRLIERIATRRVTITTDDRQRVDITLGEAVLIASRQDMSNPHDSLANESKAELRRYGIKVDGDSLVIANNCSTMAELLDGSPWAASWSRTLSEIEGATKEPHQHFAPGIKSRAVGLPVGVFS